MERDSKIDSRDNAGPAMWRTCCMTCDPRAVMFFSQLFISVGVMVFCIYQMVANGDQETRDAFMPLLTFLVGVYLPTPKISSK